MSLGLGLSRPNHGLHSRWKSPNTVGEVVVRNRFINGTSVYVLVAPILRIERAAHR